MKIGQISTMDLPPECHVVSVEACQQCAPDYAGIPLYHEAVLPKGQTLEGWDDCTRTSSSSSSPASSSSSSGLNCIPSVEIITLPDGSVVTRINCDPFETPSSSSSVDCSAYIDCDPSGTIASDCGLFPEPGFTYYFDCDRCECVQVPEGSGSSSSAYGSSSSSSSACVLGPMPDPSTEYCWDGTPHINSYHLPDFASCEWTPIFTIVAECPSSSSSSSSCEFFTRHCIYLAASSLRISAVFAQEEKPPPCDYKTYCCPEGCITQCECNGPCSDDADCPNGCDCRNGYCKSPCGNPLESVGYCSEYCCSEGVCALPCVESFPAATCVACYAAAQQSKYTGIQPVWFPDGDGFETWWRDRCECYGPCSYDGQCNQGCYCCDGQCSETPCSCNVCCGLDSVLFSDPGDMNYPGSTPAHVLFQHVDPTCDSPMNVPTSYQLSVEEMGSYDVVSMTFYCGSFVGEGRTVGLELVEGSVVWQNIPTQYGNARRPSGQALYRFAPNALGASCCVQVVFNPTGGLSGNPGSASVKFRSGCASPSSSSSSSSNKHSSSSESSSSSEPSQGCVSDIAIFVCNEYSEAGESVQISLNSSPVGSFTTVSESEKGVFISTHPSLTRQYVYCGIDPSVTYINDLCQTCAFSDSVAESTFDPDLVNPYMNVLDVTMSVPPGGYTWRRVWVIAFCRNPSGTFRPVRVIIDGSYNDQSQFQFELGALLSAGCQCQIPETSNYFCDYLYRCIPNRFYYPSGGSTLGECLESCDKYWNCEYGGCEQEAYWQTKYPYQYDDEPSCLNSCKRFWSCSPWSGCEQNYYFGIKYSWEYDDETACKAECKQYWDCTYGGCEQNYYFGTKQYGEYDDDFSCAKTCVSRFYCDYYAGCESVGMSDDEQYFTDCSKNCFASDKWCSSNEGCVDAWGHTPPPTPPECPTCEKFWECNYGLPCTQSSIYSEGGMTYEQACGSCTEFFYCDNAEGCKSYWSLYNPGMYESKTACETACQERYFCSMDTCIPYGKYTYGDDEDMCKAVCPPP